MNRVFADTLFYVALLNDRDPWHSKALAAAERVFDIVTTEYVLLEVGNSLTRSVARSAFPDLAQSLYGDPQTLLIPGGKDLMQQGIALLAKHRDKSWSLTDCTSFVIMRELGITQALTADHHFEQANFTVLIR